MLFNDGGRNYLAIKAGDISLKLHNHTDIFYADDVSCYEAMPDYEALVGIPKVGFDDGGFLTEGMPPTFRTVDIDRKETIIEGFYLDTMPITWLIPYEVRVYVRYEEDEQEINETIEAKKV